MLLTIRGLHDRAAGCFLSIQGRNGQSGRNTLWLGAVPCPVCSHPVRGEELGVLRMREHWAGLEKWFQRWRGPGLGGPRGKGSPSVSRGPKPPIQLLQLLENSPREVKRAHFRYIVGPHRSHPGDGINGARRGRSLPVHPGFPSHDTEHPLSRLVHPLIAKNNPQNKRKKFINHNFTLTRIWGFPPLPRLFFLSASHTVSDIELIFWGISARKRACLFWGTSAAFLTYIVGAVHNRYV